MITLNPHTWRKFELAQKNMLRHLRTRAKKKRRLRIHKWAREMGRQLDNIYEYKQ